MNNLRIANQELGLLGVWSFIDLSRVLFSEYFHNAELAHQAMEKYSRRKRPDNMDKSGIGFDVVV